MANLINRSCAACVKRHETGNPAAPLQCRALPPAPSVGLLATYPLVRPDDYCHTHFERDTSTLAAAVSAPAPSTDRPKRARRAQAADEPSLL